jgi:hypothetical protein
MAVLVPATTGRCAKPSCSTMPRSSFTRPRRVRIKFRNNVRVHLNWRPKLAGNVQPGSGPAVTLARDF